MIKRLGSLMLLLALILTLSGIVGMQSAHAQESDTYVVATHYPEFGGVDPAPEDDVEAAYGVYNNRENDYEAVTQERADAVLARVEEETGLDVVLLNDWADVEEDVEALQIVNNVPVEGALYTIFLPPGWTRDENMPIVLSGNGAGTSNNDRFYRGGEIIPAQLAAMSVQGGGGGLILAISNCGGTESQGIDEPTLRSVEAFLNFMDENGGDKHNVVTAGGSRGGGSALMWAINPLDLDYTVRAVFAAVPPTSYGTLSQVSILTYPSMASIGTLISHDEESWRYDGEGIQPNESPSPFLEAIIGAGDPDEANALSPLELAEGLRGKQVFLCFGVHDAFFPLSPFLAFDRRLDELDIPHGTVITLAQGHEPARYWMETLYLYLTGLSRGLSLSVPVGRYYFVDLNPPDGEEVALAALLDEQGIDADPTELPVIAQFPYRAGVGNPIDVEVCGTPGDDVSLVLADEAGEPVYELAGTIDETECITDRFTINEDIEPGEYRWVLVVNDMPVNPLNTPARDGDCGYPAVTTITEDQPAPDDTYADAHVLSFGLDEFSGQTCNIP